MIVKIVGYLLLSFLLVGCSSMKVNKDSIGVITEEFGQCIFNTKKMPTFHKREVTFICANNRVLLGDAYTKKGITYMRSVRMIKQDDGSYLFKNKKRVHVKRGLHSICQLKPFQGQGDKSIRGYYFDIYHKTCKPFIWKGEGGFVPFNTIDACEQYCNYKYQG